MKRTLFNLAVVSTTLAALLLCASASGAWDRYSTGGNNNCARPDCHGRFRSSNYISPSDGQNWGNLHNLHRETMLDGDCSTCHSGGDWLPVFLSSSNGGAGFEPISCVGCHGRNEDIGPNSDRGAGLRQHHVTAGVNVCLDCHADADPANYTPVGENVPPSYYFTPDPNHFNKPTDPCSPNGEEDYAGALQGNDNDGDGRYDLDDSDCSVGICPDTFVLVNGIESSGAFGDSCGSDDLRWTLSSTTFDAVFSPAPINLEVTGNVGAGGATLTFTMEGHPTFGGGTAFITVALFNYSTGLFEQSVFAGQADGPPDAVYWKTVDNSTGNYVDVDGSVRARITGAKTAAGPVRLNIDDMFWD